MSSISSSAEAAPLTINASGHNRTQVMTKGLKSFYKVIHSGHSKKPHEELKAVNDFQALFPTLSVDDVELSWGMGPYQFGNLTITGEIGNGTAGVVYHAHDRRTKEEKALKFIYNPNEIEVELKVLHQLRNHRPHCRYIVYLEKVIPGPNIGEYVLQFPYAGKTVHDLYIDGQSISCEDLKMMTLHVVLAIKHLNKLRLVHRDIKPDNIVHNVALRIFQLIDFSITQAEREYPYSIYYRSPDVYAKQKIDVRSDIFALGASIGQIITTTTPPFSSYVDEEDDDDKANHAHQLVAKLGPPPKDLIAFLQKRPKKFIAATADGKIVTFPTPGYQLNKEIWQEIILNGCKERGFTEQEGQMWVDFLGGIYKYKSERWNDKQTHQAIYRYLIAKKPEQAEEKA